MNIQREMAALAPEDSARADLYGLLAHVYYGPPSPQLLDAIAGADDVAALAAHDAPLAQAWRRLQAACAAADAGAVRAEYHDLFLGVGLAAVPLQASWYLAGSLNDKPLARVRGDLAALGLSRLQSSSESEDHFSALAESMRALIARAGAGGGLEDQKRFFARHIQPWYAGLVERIDAAARANFYRIVSALTRAFLDTEKAQFETY